MWSCTNCRLSWPPGPAPVLSADNPSTPTPEPQPNEALLVIVYGPANALPSTTAWSSVTLSGEKTSSSTIGPAGLDRICGKTWSLPCFRWKTTVVSSLASVLSRLYSSEAGPFGSLIFTMRSKVNLTSDEVRSWPLAHFRPGLSFTVYSVGEVNDADSAMSGLGSGLPYGVFIRNG